MVCKHTADMQVRVGTHQMLQLMSKQYLKFELIMCEHLNVAAIQLLRISLFIQM